jgi:hypothetical protein
MKLLLTGVPGAGKTHLRELLVSEHGSFGMSLNDEDAPSPSDAVRVALYDRLHRKRQPRRLADDVMRIDGDVVIEWGFPINDSCLRFACTLRRRGLTVVWLECDDAAARERFLRRGTVDVVVFDAQLARIRDGYARIMDMVAPAVVQVLRSDGTPRSCDELLAEITTRNMA